MMAELDPENERIRGYLQAQAAKNTIDQIKAKVQESVDALHAAANAFSVDECVLRPAGESWTPVACLSHCIEYNLAAAQKVIYVALTGELPADEDRALPADRDGLLAAHAEAMDSLYIHLADAEPAYFLTTKWEHEMFGDLNWREWFLFLRIHNMDHARQMEAMKAALA